MPTLMCDLLDVMKHAVGIMGADTTGVGLKAVTAAIKRPDLDTHANAPNAALAFPSLLSLPLPLSLF